MSAPSSTRRCLASRSSSTSGTAWPAYTRQPDFTLSLIRHADGTGTRFTQRQTGLDHLGLTARNRAELLGWEQRLRELDVELTPVRDSELGHHLNFRDPDGIALEFYAPNDRFAAALDELRSRKFSDEELLDAAEQQLGLGAYVARRSS